MFEQYKTVDGKKMRMGYTTGSCAAAASKAAAIMLVTGKELVSVNLSTPKGIELTLEIKDITLNQDFVCCSVQKFAGDDPDATDGMFIYAKVSKINKKTVIIDSSNGIGKVTKPGLNQPVGNAAINNVPRKMITSELLSVIDDYNLDYGFKTVISAPEGQERAKKTFNPRLGIVGGISILGTSGIVEPMSDKALLDTIKAEINVHKAAGETSLLITPGNYGKEFLSLNYDFLDLQSVKCSNFIGASIEYAAEIGFEEVLLIGHFGKMVKLAAGLFNTHSRYGDCRGEIIASNAILAGATLNEAKNILSSATVDEMIMQIKDEKIREKTIRIIFDKIYDLTNGRVYGKIKVETVSYTQKLGFIAQTKNAESLAKKIKEQQI